MSKSYRILNLKTQFCIFNHLHVFQKTEVKIDSFTIQWTCRIRLLRLFLKQYEEHKIKFIEMSKTLETPPFF